MKRGRKSGAALAVATIAPLQKSTRPDAPYDLTDEQATEWRAVVNRMPADWFPRETWPLLTQHCRHVVNARRCAQLLTQHEGAEDFNLEDYGKLLALQDRETKAVLATARALRLSQQARLEPKTAWRSARDSGNAGPRPWEGYDG